MTGTTRGCTENEGEERRMDAWMHSISWLDLQEAHLTTDRFAQGLQLCTTMSLARISSLQGWPTVLLASNSRSHHGHASSGLHGHGQKPVLYPTAQFLNSWRGRRCFQGEQSHSRWPWSAGTAGPSSRSCPSCCCCSALGVAAPFSCFTC